MAESEEERMVSWVLEVTLVGEFDAISGWDWGVECRGKVLLSWECSESVVCGMC